MYAKCETKNNILKGGFTTVEEATLSHISEVQMETMDVSFLYRQGGLNDRLPCSLCYCTVSYTSVTQGGLSSYSKD